jgi:hypothetical protein
MRNHPQWRKEPLDTSANSTALHMADAIGFLVRVANEAGFASVALRLAGIRTSLLDPDILRSSEGNRESRQSGGANSATDDDAHERNETSKPH